MASSGAAVYAKMVPVGSSAGKLIHLRHLQATFTNSKLTSGSLPGASVYSIGEEIPNIAPELRRCFFSIKYDDKINGFAIMKEPASLSLMVSSGGAESLQQWNEVAPSTLTPLNHGSILHLDAGAFVARWRWVTKPSNSNLSPLVPFNARQSLQMVIDDQVLNFANVSTMSQSASQSLLSSSVLSSSVAALDDSASMPPPSKKRKREETTCVALEDVPRDKGTGQAKMPIPLAGGVTLLELGTVDAVHEKFHNNRYIFPIGFKSKRMYWSFVEPTRRVAYIQEIRSVAAKTKQGTDTAEPLFVLTCEDAPDQPLSSSTPSGVWSILRERTKAQREEKAGKKLSTNISGQDQFGLSNGIVKALIEELPNAKLCKRYWETSTAASSSSADQMDM